MRCIDAALAEDFSALNATQSVPAGEFMRMLNQIMLGLSVDITNIDLVYFDFILLEIEGEISEYQRQSLLRSVTSERSVGSIKIILLVPVSSPQYSPTAQ